MIPPRKPRPKRGRPALLQDRQRHAEDAQQTVLRGRSRPQTERRNLWHSRKDKRQGWGGLGHLLVHYNYRSEKTDGSALRVTNSTAIVWSLQKTMYSFIRRVSAKASDDAQ